MLIALEEHLATAGVLAAWPSDDDDSADIVTRNSRAKADVLTDVDDGRLRAMDEAGIDVAVLSVTSPGLQHLPRADALALQGPTNDEVAAAVARHPDRFGGFATLATPDPDAAADELVRAVTELGLDGAMLHTTTGETGEELLDAPRFRPIFEAAARLRAPIYLHPSVAPPAVDRIYYQGLPEPADALLGLSAPGWHYQTGLALLRLILAGVFDRFPDLQVIVGHWGELVLFYLDRIADLDAGSGLERPVADYFRRNVYITASGIASQRYLRWAIEVIGVDRVMSSTDYPFIEHFDARGFLAEAALTEGDRELIASGTWTALRDGIRRTA